MSITKQFSDDPSSNTPPPSNCLEVDQGVAQTRDGVFVKDSAPLRSRLCHSRYSILVALLVLACFLLGTDIFERRDLSLPSEADDSKMAAPLNNAMDTSKEEDKKQVEEGLELVGDEDDEDDKEEGKKQEENGSELIDDDDDEGDEEEDQPKTNNVVDLDAKNPKRDGVEFISPTCNYTCMTDRLPHESPLYPGQVLCNEEHRFGMTDEGEFFMQDCLLDTVKIIWSAKDAKLKPDQFPIHFELQKNGHFQIISDPTGEILLEDGPKRNVTYHYMCLHNNPKLDCPYLHLHPDGVLVINWIADHKWMARNVKQQYLGLFPDTD